MTLTLLVVFIGLLASTFSQILERNICSEQTTCGQCIAAGPKCGWCRQENIAAFDNRERCDIVDTLIANHCDDLYIENPRDEIRYERNMPPRNSNERGQEAIQLSPQNVTIKIRPKSLFKFNVAFRQAENYPVDLYYVMDMSQSMNDDKEKLALLGDLLAQKMRGITQNFRLGYGSFVDKKTMPYVSTVPAKLESPCEGCASPYGFRNQLKLTEDTAMFRDEVNRTQISGNLDSPEGGFDAIMQAVMCQDQIGWRPQSRKMLLFSTDASFHYAGDGKLGGIVIPNDGECHLDRNGLYTESLTQDYPSISQLAHKISESKVNVIFAVTKDQVPTYNELTKLIEGSTAGELADDSANIVELVKENYDKISGSVELKADGNEDVTVSFKTRCFGTDLLETAKCDNVGIGQNVSYEVSITVNSCPSDPKLRKKSFYIYPVGLTEKLVVNLELACECDCEKQTPKAANSPRCNNHGIYECSACTCNDGRYGRKCECDASTLASEDYDATCRMTNTSAICEGHGQCVCGKCECNPGFGGSSIRFHGTYCQCNEGSCPRFEGMPCGGPERGRCDCSTCKCREGYSGEDCHCRLSNSTCLTSKGVLCNNLGKCNCGRCECNPNSGYKGPTCEDCPTCPGKCDQIKGCVLCKGFGTGPLKDDTDQCQHKCNNTKAVDELTVNDEWKQCPPLRDETDNCDVFYAYHYASDDRVHVQKTKRCTAPVNVLAIVLGVIGGILLIGLILLLIWKLLVTIHDRREFARFEKEREKARWDMDENPIYKQATSTYSNPTYRR